MLPLAFCCVGFVSGKIYAKGFYTVPSGSGTVMRVTSGFPGFDQGEEEQQVDVTSTLNSPSS